MVKKHIKRLSAPKSWPILRKERTWVTRPRPGRPFKLAISLSNALKELLSVARTSKEARYLLQHIGVEVNGVKAASARQPVAFMDVISIPDQDQHWRLGLTKKGRLCAVAVDKKQAKRRIVKIKNKTRVGKKIQINCEDGTNLLIDKNKYKTGDCLLLENGAVKKHLPLKKGMQVILTSGTHLSEVGTVTDLSGDTIYFEKDGEQLSTAKSCAFVIGEKESEVVIR